MSEDDKVGGVMEVSRTQNNFAVAAEYIEQNFESNNGVKVSPEPSKDAPPVVDASPILASEVKNNETPIAAGGAETTNEVSSVAPSVANIISPNELDSVLQNPEIFTDTDKDGIANYLDATTNETLIEQAYDKEAAKASEKNVRSFISLIAMLSNLDLSRLNTWTINGDAQSLATQAIAGCAQVAIMNSSRFKELSEIPMAKREDVKELINKFRKQSEDLKKKNLSALASLVQSLPKPEAIQEFIQKIRR